MFFALFYSGRDEVLPQIAAASRWRSPNIVLSTAFGPATRPPPLKYYLLLPPRSNEETFPEATATKTTCFCTLA